MPATAESDRARRDPGSFRDPSGFVYSRDGVLLRQINASFAADWDDLVASGLLTTLQERGLLVAHEPAPIAEAANPETAHAVIRPERIDFISYPYEWSFGMLRDAALLTLDAQALAFEQGFTLRDATAYNVQFRRGRPVLIDTLSFERAEEGRAVDRVSPVLRALPRAARADGAPRRPAGLMLRDFIDGIPLDLAARLLPGRTRWNLGLGPHIHAHARAQARFADRGDEAAAATKRTTVSPLKQRRAHRQPPADDPQARLDARRNRVGRLRGEHLVR